MFYFILLLMIIISIFGIGIHKFIAYKFLKPKAKNNSNKDKINQILDDLDYAKSILKTLRNRIRDEQLKFPENTLETNRQVYLLDADIETLSDTEEFWLEKRQESKLQKDQRNYTEKDLNKFLNL